jgi:hypothetical protein
MDGCDAGVEVEMKMYNQAWLLRGRNVWIQLSLEYSWKILSEGGIKEVRVW